MATADIPDTAGRHFQCPFCNAYEVARLYVGSVGLDSCECTACGSRWDEDSVTGAFRGRGDRSSVLMRRRERD